MHAHVLVTDVLLDMQGSKPHTSTLLSTQSLSCTVLCRVGGSLSLVRGMAHGNAGRAGGCW